MIHVSEYNHPEEIKQLQSVWHEMHGRTRNASWFQSWEWLNQYLLQSHQKLSLKVLSVSLAGKTIGIVPLVVKPVQTRLGTMKALTYPLDSWGVHYSQIGPNPAATLAATMRYLQSSRRDWDLFDLRYIDELDSDVGRTRNALRLSGFQRFQRMWSESSLLRMKDNWADVWNSLPENTVREYHRSESALMKRGTYELHRYRPDQNAATVQDHYWEIFSKFEKLASGTPGFCPGMRENKAGSKDWRFLRCLHEKAVSSGALDLCWLVQNDEVISVSYNYHHRGRIDSLGTVYSPEAGPEAANVLMGCMFEDGFHRYDSSYYFSEEKSGLNLNWGNSLANSYRYSHFPLFSPRSQLIRMYQWAFHKDDNLPIFSESDDLPAATETRTREPVNQNENKFKVVG